MVPTFEPPTVNDVPGVAWGEVHRYDPLAIRLGRHLGPNPRGRTVVKSTAGVYSTVDNPPQSLLDAAAKVYLGGHVYEVSADEATALENAGYTVAD